MKKLLTKLGEVFLTAGLILAACLSAGAQETQGSRETPKAELFGGYSYAGSDTHGWNGSIAGNVNRWLALVADVSATRRARRGGVSERIRTRTFVSGRGFPRAGTGA